MHAPRERGGISNLFAASRRKGTSKVKVYVSATRVSLGYLPQPSSGCRLRPSAVELTRPLYITMSMTAASFGEKMSELDRAYYVEKITDAGLCMKKMLDR